MYSRYAQVFNKQSVHFTENPAKNLRFLKQCQDDCNTKLYSKGYLYLTDVYDMIGIHKMPIIEGMGWWLDTTDKDMSNYVDFGIYDRTKKTSRDFVNGLQPDIILDFNIDGNLADYLLDLGFHLGGPDMAREFFEKQDLYKQYLLDAGYSAMWWNSCTK